MLLTENIDAKKERPDEDIAVETKNEAPKGFIINKFANEYLQKLLEQQFSSLDFKNAEDLGNRGHQKKRKRSNASDPGGIPDCNPGE